MKRWTVLAMAAAGAMLLACGCANTPAGADGGRAAPADRGGAPRPLIGLSSAYVPDGDYVKVPCPYARAIEEAGGTAVILPVTDDVALVVEYVRVLDGLVLSGGDDVPPEAYGEKPLEQTKTLSPLRHRFEKALVEAWLPTGKPILGICRGAQEINVVRGGTLVQDLPTQVGTAVIHRLPKGQGDASHPLAVAPGTTLHALLGSDRVEVNSNHHQAVKKAGKGLRVAARSPDGVIEALEFTGGRFGLLVQWHPERMGEADHRRAIYGTFVRACRQAAPVSVPAGATAP